MLDIKAIRNESELIQAKLRKRDPDIDLSPLLKLDKQRRELLIEVEEYKRQKNEASKKISSLKKLGEDASTFIEEMQTLAETIKLKDKLLSSVEQEIEDFMVALPNIPDDSVPCSMNPQDKIVVREFGEKTCFNFKPANHVEIATSLGLLDFQRGAKISGSQFPLYINLGARLEWALISFMLECNIKMGYVPVIPPFLANTSTLFSSGQLPKFEEQVYKCRDDDLFLIPTSEVPLTGLHRDEILDEKILPLKYTSYTPCFRREAGTYGAEERGLIRVHQFNKVEIFKYVVPETSEYELESLVQNAESLVKKLGLHYRVVNLVTGDIGQQAAKTYDIEVWLPGQNAYYEVSSCSNCRDYQARRASIRYRSRKDQKTYFVHTLNGSCLATSRLLVAILENNQQQDGSVIIPEVLRQYLDNMERIARN